MTNTDRHDETDRRLLLLVGLVVVCATIATTFALYHTATTSVFTVQGLASTAALISLVAVGFTIKVRIRIRATYHYITWTEMAVVVGLAMAPVEWVVLCTGLGVTFGAVIARMSPLKITFTISKNLLLAAAAGLALQLADGSATDQPLEMVWPLAVAYFTAVAMDEVLTLPVIALATATRFSQLFREDIGLRVASAVARFGLIVGTLVILDADDRLLVAIPPLVLSLHLAYSNRTQARAEQQAWQRLAQATDALNVVDLDTVLSTAVSRAAELFSADVVEVELHTGKLVRGDGRTITYRGTPGDAPALTGTVTPVTLEGHDSAEDIGILRLCFNGPVALSERERYTLRTFASALCTAVRNATAYAELSRAADQHAHAAAHDALTGLANRRELLHQGTRILDNRQSSGITALLLIDLNHFKEVNDTLGHAAGDRVLIQVAERLRATVHTGDLVARLGGDEFAVLLTGLPAPAIATHRAERLLSAVHEPLTLDGMRINVEASGGIATAPGEGGMAELLRRADVAMYHAKRNGRRIAAYAPGRDTADLCRLSLAGDLARAMADREFTVNFQPIVDLGTGEAVAAEALTRWEHPVHGRIDPLYFLEAIERSGLLPAFTEIVLDQSLLAVASWRKGGFDLPVAVNVSPRSLLDAEFPGTVLARLKAHRIPADRLFLELTETLTLSQLEIVDRVLGQLRDAGVRLALDDFGTGYSSLSVLSRVPVHELKIDRGFVTAMENSTESTAVIRSTVDLGRSLGLVVVAEGVESEPQRHALWELGCTAGQGHLFARPMPAARLLALLRKGTGGRPGTLAAPLHDEGSVIRLLPGRRSGTRRTDRLPHLPA